jgi:hypothetical protein
VSSTDPPDPANGRDVILGDVSFAIVIVTVSLVAAPTPS